MNKRLTTIHAGKKSAKGDQQQSARSAKEFLPTMILSILLGVFLMGALVYFANPWNILANTRLLRLVIDSGFVKYHDRDAGFVEGVADHSYYLKAQEPVEWTVILLAFFILVAFWALEAYRFHAVARYHGIPGSFGQHARAYLTGLMYSKFMPLHFGWMAGAAALQKVGATPAQAYSSMFLFRSLLVFSIGAFAVFGLLALGWAAWVVQMLLAFLFLGAFYWWSKSAVNAANRVSVIAAVREHLQALLQRPASLSKFLLLAIIAFGMEDIVTYLLTMAFSTQQVLLHVTFDILLVAFAAGYLARLYPLTPGGIGQFEWAFTGILYLGGLGLPEAASVAILFSLFYYLSLGAIYLVTLPWNGLQLSFRSILDQTFDPLPANNRKKETTPKSGDRDADVLANIPSVPVPQMPSSGQLWGKGIVASWVALAVFLFDQLTLLLSDFWLLESLGFSDVFWTNFRMGAILFTVGSLAFAAGISIPAFTHPLPQRARRLIVGAGLIIGLIAGYRLAPNYHEFLLLDGQAFGERDPIFGLDVGFYVFTLPAWWIVWRAAVWLFLATLTSSILCAAFSSRTQDGKSSSRLTNWLGRVATAPTLAALTGLGIVAAAGVWLRRFNLLTQEGYATSVFTGASYIDVNGLFSTLNQIQLTAVVVAGLTVCAAIMLRAVSKQTSEKRGGGWSRQARLAGTVAVWLIGIDFAFAGAVSIRDTLFVTPNQPVVQLPYIERHITATRNAYGLDKVEEIEFVPNHGDDPMPAMDEILSSNIMKNAPLWPAYVSYLEQLVDPQHSQRIIQTAGDNMIYGPSLEIFRQQEKLRTYYDFLDVDVLRYTINGEKVVLASAVRELPILEPQPWLAWWGQRFMLFTHGHGLVMAPVGQVTAEGDPVFVSGQIPITTSLPEVTITNPQVYYGEGNASMAVSNVRSMSELDFPTNQGRAENVLPLDADIGVKVDSLLKRLVFGWRSGEFFEMVFSSLITPETRVHYFRQPLQRLEHVAPFLYFESNPYATVVNGDITWLVNAVTVSDQYPYSKHEFIGDKSQSRSPQAAETERINYVEDSVKATINAATGQVQLYKIADEPVINTWAKVYPTLFTDGEQMPAEVRQQITYPLQLFHLQFDDLYIYYHMNDPMYFFNMEDMWDDADEVLGPVMDSGKAITFSIEPYNMLIETGGILPESSEKHQFVMTMPYTPEGARNLRAMPMVYQDGEDYGRLFVLMIPKGLFITGPEQADSAIDQDPDISEKISWWNRLGTEVIRGHTSLLLIENELVYVEPLFIRSEQNALTQLKRVLVVVRGKAYMHETLEGALTLAFSNGALETVASGP